MPLDIQVKKEFLHTRAFRMNCEIDIGQESIRADHIERKATCWAYHPEREPFIDFDDVPIPLESSQYHRGVRVFTDGSKTTKDVVAGWRYMWAGR